MMAVIVPRALKTVDSSITTVSLGMLFTQIRRQYPETLDYSKSQIKVVAERLVCDGIMHKVGDRYFSKQLLERSLHAVR